MTPTAPTLQAEFAAALTDPDAPLPPGLRTWNGSSAAQRFAVYRNNVAVALIEALRAKFPVTQKAIGRDDFTGLALAYIRQSPPQHVVMAAFGDDFPQFMTDCGVAADWPYVPDLARLEAQRVTAFHAADATVLEAGALAAILPDVLGDAVIRLHPAATVVRSAYAIASLWAAHQGAGDPAELKLEQAEEALVSRPGEDVLVTLLAPGVATALERLAAGDSLGAAVVAASDIAGFDPSSLFITLINTGAAEAVRLPGEPI